MRTPAVATAGADKAVTAILTVVAYRVFGSRSKGNNRRGPTTSADSAPGALPRLKGTDNGQIASIPNRKFIAAARDLVDAHVARKAVPRLARYDRALALVAARRVRK